MKRTFVLLISIILLFSCKKENKVGGGKIELLTLPESSITNLSDIATDIEYIPLQTINSSLVGTIGGLKIQGEKIFVRSTEEIFCFNKTGQFLFKLSKEGRGPGEYQYIYDFEINTNGDLLIFISNSEMMVYRIEEDGFVFIKSFSIKPGGVDYPSEVLDIAFIPGRNDILISYQNTGEEPLSNIIINLEGDTLNSRPNYYKFKNRNNVGMSSPLANIKYVYNNSLFFKGMQSDTVFTINKNNDIVPYVVLDTEGTLPTPEDSYEFVNQDLSVIFTSVPFRNNLVIKNIIETDRFFLYGYSYLGTSVMEVYDKVEKKKYGINSDEFLVDDICGGVSFNPQISFDGKLYSWVDAFSLKKYFSDISYNGFDVKENGKIKRMPMEELVDSLKDYDNPILIAVTLKE